MALLCPWGRAIDSDAVTTQAPVRLARRCYALGVGLSIATSRGLGLFVLDAPLLCPWGRAIDSDPTRSGEPLISAVAGPCEHRTLAALISIFADGPRR